MEHLHEASQTRLGEQLHDRFTLYFPFVTIDIENPVSEQVLLLPIGLLPFSLDFVLIVDIFHVLYAVAQKLDFGDSEQIRFNDFAEPKFLS